MKIDAREIAALTQAQPAAPRMDMYASIHKALRAFMADTLLGLLEVLDENGGRSSSGAALTPAESKALESRWLAFLKAKRATIDAEKRISFDDPAVTRDLVPRGFIVHRKGKPNWP